MLGVRLEPDIEKRLNGWQRRQGVRKVITQRKRFGNILRTARIPYLPMKS